MIYEPQNKTFNGGHKLIKHCFWSSLGYGILGLDKASSSRDLCAKQSDDFTKEHETVFQLKIGDFSNSNSPVQHDIIANEWIDYSDTTNDKAGYLCEKEGNIKANR